MKKAPTSLTFDEFPSYKGGSTLFDGNYIWEFCPEHHLRNKWGWVPQAWLVAEDKLGRPLLRDADKHKSECVHHIDEVKTNNHPDNLEVMTMIEHWRHHLSTLKICEPLPLTVEQVAAAMEEAKTVWKASKLLHCSTQTLHNRFYETIKPYIRRPIFADYDNVELTAKITVCAGDPYMKVADIQWDNALTVDTVRHMCRRHGIRWKRRRTKGKLKSTYRGRPTSRDPEVIAFVREQILAGATLEAVAEPLGLTRDTIRVLCRKNNIQYIKKKNHHPSRLHKTIPVRCGKMTSSNPHTIEYVRKQLGRGASLEAVAENLGLRVSAVRCLCRKNQIPYPRNGWWANAPFPWTANHESSEPRAEPIEPEN